MSRGAAESYRPEIDGLRAIAVMPVVLYHFGVPGVGGGFVGVDVFFVISGFLIGGILWAEIESRGRVRLGAFFMRRIRRLAPAYLVMAFVTLIGAWALLLPFDFREFGQELVAATVYLANFHYFNDAGYFDAASDKKLLLHTWSLAVEEQFYLVLPILMLLLARWSRRLPWILAGLGVLSLAACLWMMRVSAPAAFYLFPFRAWELLAGVCLAVWGQRTEFDWRLPAAVSWTGLALIAVAVLTFEAGDHFPGLYALVPVAGSVLIIAGGQGDNAINRMLCSRPFLFFGLISYSLYLWHWPLVTLWKYVMGAPSPLQVASLLVVAVAVSWLSWRIIETPVRRGALAGRRLLAGYATTATATVAVALSFAFSDGWPERFPPEARPFIDATRDFIQDWSRCETPRSGPWEGVEICPIGPEGPPRVLVWGDSHARAFKEGLDRVAHERGTAGLLIWHAGCPPLLGVSKDELVATASQNTACTVAQGRVRTGLEGTPSIERLLLIGRWAYYAEGTGVGRDAENRIKLNPLPGVSMPSGTQAEMFSAALAQTVAFLAAEVDHVFLLRQIPEIPFYSAAEAANAVVYRGLPPEDVCSGIGSAPRDRIEARAATADLALREVAGTQDKVSIIDFWADLCTPVACSAMLEGQPIYFDNNHVTNTGALALRSHFETVFE